MINSQYYQCPSNTLTSSSQAVGQATLVGHRGPAGKTWMTRGKYHATKMKNMIFVGKIKRVCWCQCADFHVTKVQPGFGKFQPFLLVLSNMDKYCVVGP